MAARARLGQAVKTLCAAGAVRTAYEAAVEAFLAGLFFELGYEVPPAWALVIAAEAVDRAVTEVCK